MRIFFILVALSIPAGCQSCPKTKPPGRKSEWPFDRYRKGSHETSSSALRTGLRRVPNPSREEGASQKQAVRNPSEKDHTPK